MELYSQIESCIRKQRSLASSINQIYKTLLPKRKFRHENLTQQQCLALVYDHIRAPLNKLKQKIEHQLKEQTESNDQQAQQVGEANVNEEEQNMQHGIEENKQQDMGQMNQYQEGNQEQENNQGQEQDQYDEQQGQLNGQQNEMGSEDDVGLYGEQIDEQDMQSYENQQMDDDPQFGNFKLNKIQQRNQHQLKLKRLKQGQEDLNEQDHQDDFIEDNFDQFRQIQRDNKQVTKQQPVNQLEKQIQKLEERAMGGKNWVLGGQVKAKQRPVNSLLGQDLQFKSGVKFTHQITQGYNNNLQSIIKQRILDEIFDDRVRNIPMFETFGKSKLQNVSTDKSSKGLAQLYELQFKNNLGLGDNKNEKLKKDIMDSLKQINYFLDSLSNTGFAVKPKSRMQKNGSQAIILQDKVPVTNWNGVTQPSNIKTNFESEKQVNKKTKRLRNKRNARQRKKQQDKKKINRVIEYGGMTKIQAQARKKIAKSKQSGPKVKYSKSSSFFNNINNKSKAGKPNPNISKLKS